MHALSSLPASTTVTQLRQFICLALYFRKFVPKFSRVMKPLYALTSDNKNTTWTDRHGKIRQKVISALTDAPVLMVFDPNYPIELRIDASSDGYEVILMHKIEGKNRVVEYYSKRTSPAESRYHSYELETLAIVNAVKHFLHYLHGREFLVVTDYNSLKASSNKVHLNDMVYRWWAYLQTFTFDIMYRKCKRMAHVDFFSRNPVDLDRRTISKATEREINLAEISEDWLLTEQRRDPQITEIATTGASRANGQVERIMGTLKNMFTTIETTGRSWQDAIGEIQLVLNCTANRVTKSSPLEPLIGKTARPYGLSLPDNIEEREVDISHVRQQAIKNIDASCKYDKDRILVNNKIIIARHVEFIGEDDNLVGFQGEDESDNEREKDFDQHSDSNEIHENEINEEKVEQIAIKEERNLSNESERKLEDTENNLKRSGRERKKSERYGQTSSYFIYVNVVSADSPQTYEEALSGDASGSWKEAMDREMNSLIKNKTWKLVEKPKDKKVLDLKWVYTNKSDNRKKAQLVVRGFQQKEVLENLYSPVAKMQTLKLLLSYCCQYGLTITQMDVETVFLNGTIKSEVFVKQPVGYDDKSGKVCKVYEKTRISKKQLINMWKKKKRKIDEIKNTLSNKFGMKDLGEAKIYIGINIEYDYKKCEIKLDQSSYIELLAKQYNIENSKLYFTPMEQNLSLAPAQSASDDIRYRNLTGVLLYISTGTRLDVSYSVNYLSRFQNSYHETHYKYALRILKYLRSFIKYALEKERLILEVKRKMDEDVRIHLIVIGLPIDIEDKIEKVYNQQMT
ncbi:uncharacterized protein LOC126875157 [Bombus huntii]|uniref:uncharacterized protein LOC126875157 n=1 Tax=Bombus huntii TaxID=85661 RepID=UPI0021AA5EC2|nr:uncharacterized protein LOC126875157 [Bombus huntii]